MVVVDTTTIVHNGIIELARQHRPLFDVTTDELLIELCWREAETPSMVDARLEEGRRLAELFDPAVIADLRKRWLDFARRERRAWLRSITDEELAAQILQMRYSILSQGVGEEEKAFHQHELRELTHEQGRRKGIRLHDPDNPDLPAETPSDRALRTRIDRAHAHWPIDRFCRDMLNVELRRFGGYVKGLCPLHKEKTASFVVYPDTGRARCYGCGKGGDIFDLAQEYFDCSFYEALDRIEATY